MICKPTQSGGSGVKNLQRFNQILLGKWFWRYGMDREALWKQVVEVKYESIWGGWCTKEDQEAYGVGAWKGIRRGWNRFHTSLSFSRGNGERVKFWHDPWCGDSPLKGAFSDLFSITASKDAAVADLMLVRNGKILWKVDFMRNFQDWEMDSMVSFLNLIYSVSFNESGVDELWWQ